MLDMILVVLVCAIMVVVDISCGDFMPVKIGFRELLMLQTGWSRGLLEGGREGKAYGGWRDKWKGDKEVVVGLYREGREGVLFKNLDLDLKYETPTSLLKGRMLIEVKMLAHSAVSSLLVSISI
ncbi:hypothetical protein Acr_17g0003080 [Actinidia rufa]|uniref:Uncharacterized protein n=1 Tax=Actinidia rufa TaxID=165716 RepID=A0A7J0G1S4_9ERIC|nr:hypothetical protein Acr_17g0003080 [Actinidia rufa]